MAASTFNRAASSSVLRLSVSKKNEFIPPDRGLFNPWEKDLYKPMSAELVSSDAMVLEKFIGQYTQHFEQCQKKLRDLNVSQESFTFYDRGEASDYLESVEKHDDGEKEHGVVEELDSAPGTLSTPLHSASDPFLTKKQPIQKDLEPLTPTFDQKPKSDMIPADPTQDSDSSKNNSHPDGYPDAIAADPNGFEKFLGNTTENYVECTQKLLDLHIPQTTYAYGFFDEEMWEKKPQSLTTTDDHYDVDGGPNISEKEEDTSSSLRPTRTYKPVKSVQARWRETLQRSAMNDIINKDPQGFIEFIAGNTNDYIECDQTFLALGVTRNTFATLGDDLSQSFMELLGKHREKVETFAKEDETRRIPIPAPPPSPNGVSLPAPVEPPVPKVKPNECVMGEDEFISLMKASLGCEDVKYCKDNYDSPLMVHCGGM